MDMSKAYISWVDENLSNAQKVFDHFHVIKQFPIPVIGENKKMELGFRGDLLVENKVIVEIKSIEIINPIHCKQLLTYLKLTGIKVGLLINFNEELLKTGIKRIINGVL